MILRDIKWEEQEEVVTRPVCLHHSACHHNVRKSTTRGSTMDNLLRGHCNSEAESWSRLLWKYWGLATGLSAGSYGRGWGGQEVLKVLLQQQQWSLPALPQTTRQLLLFLFLSLAVLLPFKANLDWAYSNFTKVTTTWSGYVRWKEGGAFSLWSLMCQSILRKGHFPLSPPPLLVTFLELFWRHAASSCSLCSSSSLLQWELNEQRRLLLSA